MDEMDEIKLMKEYLTDAEAFVDRVYYYAMERGAVADELRSDMNAAGNCIHGAHRLLDKLRDVEPTIDDQLRSRSTYFGNNP